MGSAAKAYTGVAPELGTSLGLMQLLTPTTVANLPASLTAAIPGAVTQGMQLLLVAYNHTATGTLTATGTAPLTVGAVTETSTTLPLLTSEQPGTAVSYLTSAVFGAVNASGITVSGLTNGTVTVYGVQAATRMVVGETTFSDKRKDFMPIAQRNTYSKVYYILPEAYDPEWTYQGDFYPDNAFAFMMGAINSTWTPTALGNVAVLGSTSVVGSGSNSASLQPTAPGMVLVIALTGGPASAQTVSVTGTNVFGETITEVVVPSTKTNGTWTSSNIFLTIATNGISYGAFGGAAAITVTGRFGWSQTATLGDTLSTLALCNYDSTGSFCMPYGYVNELDLEFAADAELKLSAKGPCQAVLPAGDMSSATAHIPTLAQPLDEAITGYRTQIFIDAISGTAGTTQNKDVVSGKFSVVNDIKPKHVSWGNPPSLLWDRAYRLRREVRLELLLDMTSTTYNTEYNAFKKGTKRLIQINVQGPLLGIVSNVAYYSGMQITLPVKWIEEPVRDYSVSKESVEVKLVGVAYYDPVLGYECSVTLFNRILTW